MANFSYKITPLCLMAQHSNTKGKRELQMMCHNDKETVIVTLHYKLPTLCYIILTYVVMFLDRLFHPVRRQTQLSFGV